MSAFSHLFPFCSSPSRSVSSRPALTTALTTALFFSGLPAEKFHGSISNLVVSICQIRKDLKSAAAAVKSTIYADSGRCYGSQSRRSWQTPEHDGLLGSGSFPRPSAHAGVTAPKVQKNEKYQLSKSNEPYHPPLSYKALPHLRKDIDSFNDETFGSSECTSRDKSEEEMKRRASCEVMRKEHLKVLQEKQKNNEEAESCWCLKPF